MAGGKRERLNMDIEKPLIEIEGRTILERISTVLQNAKVDEILVAITKNTPKTEEKAKKLNLKTIRTPGKGYVEDTQLLERKFNEFLSVSADLPFLTSSLIKDLLAKYDELKRPISVVTSKQSYKKMGLSPSLTIGDFVPIGLNIVTEGKDCFYSIEGKETISFNSREELERIMVEGRS